MMWSFRVLDLYLSLYLHRCAHPWMKSCQHRSFLLRINTHYILGVDIATSRNYPKASKNCVPSWRCAAGAQQRLHPLNVEQVSVGEPERNIGQAPSNHRIVWSLIETQTQIRKLKNKNKILLPSLHIKLGLMTFYVRALSEDSPTKFIHEIFLNNTHFRKSKGACYTV